VTSFRTEEELATWLSSTPRPPADLGVVRLLVARGPGKGDRAAPAAVVLRPGAPLPGDRWSPARDPGADSQLTAMEWAFAAFVAGDDSPALAGDNLLVDLDLSAANLPPGTTLRVGAAICEVTPKPHTGCRSFAARFGVDALAFLSAKKPLRLRGLHLRVRQAGRVAVGDPIAVLARSQPSLPFGGGGG
jgi:hypothetical protein